MRYTKEFLINRMQFVRSAERARKEKKRFEEGLSAIVPGADRMETRSHATVYKAGDSYEVYEYQRAVIMGRSRGGRLAEGEISERETENRILSITRAKRNIRRLVNTNFNQGSKFVTLTFRENATLKSGTPINIRDITETNKAFKQYIQRLRRYIERIGKNGDFKYLAVIEFQDANRNGVVHYHMVADLPYVKHETLAEIWGMGFIGINLIDNCDNIGAYLVKYLIKDLAEPRLKRKKAYLPSKGLERPEKLTGEEAHRIVQDLERENKKNKVYQAAYPSEYLGQITYTQYNMNQNEKYRKIRRQDLLSKRKKL